MLKLIAETEEENLMLDGLSALMEDLGVATTPLRMEDSYAMVVWSVAELSYLYSGHFGLNYEEARSFLEDIEPYLNAAMLSAGTRLIDRILQRNTFELADNRI